MKHLAGLKYVLLVALSLLAVAQHVDGQLFKPRVAKPQQLIYRQSAPVYNQEAYARLSPENASVVVSLGRQRVYVMSGGAVAIDSPISSGKASRPTPSGSFKIMQKDKDHRSNVYGNFVDRQGRIIRGGVSALIDSAPSGTHFEGAPMTYFCRLTPDGVGMHIGILPGYPASHGCIRLPSDVAAAIFSHVKVGTPVRVAN
jgi:lipoprotein-anchoring transpeptidase ErfK/SrfK